MQDEIVPPIDINFPYAYGEPEARAIFRAFPEDFQVDEELGFLPSGEGEHVCLHIRKIGENTAWVAGLIAELADVDVNDIGYCGRKDRHAITTQWFSVYLPDQRTVDWSALNSNSVYVISVARHARKLRRGDHLENRFVIRLRNIETADRQSLENRISQIFAQGVPNYFGEQRFGRDGSNLLSAQDMFVHRRKIKDKQRKGLYMSAARSYLFNKVLGQRVLQGNWASSVGGDLEYRNTAPLWGRGRSLVSGELADLEAQVLSSLAVWCDGLEFSGLAQERRDAVLLPRQGQMAWEQNALLLCFTLDAGEFATSVLREIAVLENVATVPE